MYPATALRRLRFRYLVFILGGSCANVITAFAVVPIVRSGSRTTPIVTVYFIASLFVGFVNLVPFRVRNLKSDGRQIVELIFSRQRATRIRFVGRYLEAMPDIRKHLADQDWLSAKQAAEYLLAESPGGVEVQGMEWALKNAINLSERGISAIEAAASGENQLSASSV